MGDAIGFWFSFVISAYGIPLLIYLAFAIPALLNLRTRDLDEPSRAIWALTVVAVPVMGPVAFALMNPGVGHSR